MHAGTPLIISLTLVIAAGFAGALAARAVRLPSLVGYLLVGIVLGPSGLGVFANVETVSGFADLGVALLMFALGVELSLSMLTRTKAASLIGAPIQIVLMLALGYGMGRALGWSNAQSLVAGFVLSLSSTMVIVKLLTARGGLHTRSGEAMVAISLVQDLAAVVMVAMLPALAQSTRGFGDLPALFVKGVAFLLWALLLARWIIPALIRLAAREYSKEVFVLLVAVLSFGGAASGYALGLSFALGAFLGGLVVSESHYSHELLAHVTPLRDLFGMVFFVSLGILSDLHAVAANPGWVAALLAALLIGKPLAAASGLIVARYGLGTAVASGLGLGQIGEFSFVVVTQAWQEGLLSREMHSLLVAVATLSLFVTPALMYLGEWVAARLRTLERLERLPEPTAEATPLNHVILCGYGRVGYLIGEALLAEGLPFMVVEYDAHVVADLRARGVPVIYGDASNAVLLEAAQAARARLAVVALPEGTSTKLAVGALHRANASLPIVARAHSAGEATEIHAAGARWVVYAELEAGLQMLRHALLELGKERPWVEARLDEIRGVNFHTLMEEADNGEIIG